MYKYKIVNFLVDKEGIKEGNATLEQLQNILPYSIYERLLLPGTISIKESNGNESYDISKL